MPNTEQPTWQSCSTPNSAHAQSLAAHLHCPPAIAEVLIARNIITPEAAEAFLHPSLSQLHAPSSLLGIAPAVARILQAIHAQDPILIYGDYDVDGTTATVLLKTAIERTALTLAPNTPAAVTYHVPHRIREGYGMQTNVLGLAADSGIKLMISVDTGIRAFAAADEARALALDLIITDHHLPDEIGGIPNALAVINPNQPTCPYPNKHLCGAAVAFKLAHALLLAVAPHAPDPAAYLTRLDTVLIPSFLKLVAIATIADSVPLTGENRAIAALGLAALANPVQPGLRALMQVAKLPLDRAPTATEVGFRIAPRINAAGRMDVASDVVELFLTRDPVHAATLAEKLDTLNHARRATEATALAAIENHLLTLVLADNTYPPDCVILDDPTWHRGILGILASRIVDRTGRPALVLTHSEVDGDAHGSGRSIPGFHLLECLAAASLDATHTASEPGAPPIDSHRGAGPSQSSDDHPKTLFHRFGGHAHAVGFSLPSRNLPELRTRIAAHTAIHLNPGLLTPDTPYDAELTLADLTPNLYTWVERLAPFGQQNAEPVFLTRGATLAAPVRLIQTTVQAKHICLHLTQHGLTTPIPALGWSRATTDWRARAAQLDLVPGTSVDILYRLRKNTTPQFSGIELDLCDLRLSMS